MDADKAVDKTANPFTVYYAQLLHQGNMLQDYVRTGTYRHAFLSNETDFKDKVVLDVGTGTGILALFAVQAGARKVYAVEASESAEVARVLVAANGCADKIEIVQGKLEEINLPEKVDIIISEPIGFLLVHERMLETYAVARERFLKPGGLMMPTTGSIILAPISDEALYNEQLAKVGFWNNNAFYGVDLSPVLEKANDEYFSQAVVGTFPLSSLLSTHRTVHAIDFSAVTPEELQGFDVDFSFRIDRTALMHGIAGWFDIAFIGSTEHVILSTAPECPATHWYQCRLLLPEPLAVNRGQYVSGTLKFVANEKFSYNIHMTARIDGTDVESCNVIHLHDQMYHYLSGNAASSGANANNYSSSSPYEASGTH